MGLHPSKPEDPDEYAKVLLLGIGNSGKSTLLKHLKLKYGTGLSAAEKKVYKQTIYKNTFTSLQQTLYRLNLKAITPENPRNGVVIKKIRTTNLPNYPPDELLLANEIKSLCEDPGFTRVTNPDPYFCDFIRRVTKKPYEPTLEDIFHCYLPSSNSTETRLSAGDTQFKIIDIGGTMKDRSEWSQHLESSHVLIWAVDLQEYDTKRLEEALKVFANTVNQKHVINKHVVLTFTKYDLFSEKIPNVNIHESFPEYTGPQDAESFSDYVWEKFEEADQGRARLRRATSTLAELTSLEILINVIRENHPKLAKKRALEKEMRRKEKGKAKDEEGNGAREAQQKEMERQELERKEIERMREEAYRKEVEKREAELKREAVRKVAERREVERKEAERKQTETLEVGRQVAERKEAERKEAERKGAERKEAERKEAERKEAERKEAERKEAERKEADRKEADKKEAERKEAERKEEADRKEAERKEVERKEVERKEAKRKEAERKEAERKEAEREDEKKEKEMKELEREDAKKKQTEKEETEDRKMKEQHESKEEVKEGGATTSSKAKRRGRKKT